MTLEYVRSNILKDILSACVAYWRGHRNGSDLETRVSSGHDALVMMSAMLGHYIIDEPTVNRRKYAASYIPDTMFWR